MKITLAAAAALLVSGTAFAQQPAQQRDSRGIPVMNEEATPPAGVNQRVEAPAGSTFVYAPNQQAMFATQQSTMTYPPCARGQTDRCVQSYEGTRRATRSRRGRR